MPKHLVGILAILIVYFVIHAIVVEGRDFRHRFDDCFFRVQNSSSVVQVNQLLGAPHQTLSLSKDREQLWALCYRPKTNAPVEDAFANVYAFTNGYYRYIFVIYKVVEGTTNIVNVDWGNM